MPRLALSLLGTFQATVSETSLVHFATDKMRALLAYLTVEADRPHRRDTLAALLWPDWNDSAARSNLRLTLHRLREALDAQAPALSEDLFSITRETVQVNGAAADVDVLRFMALLEMCETHPHQLLHLCPSCLSQLGEAAALYSGELLAGLSIGDAPSFEQWQLMRREELGQRVVALFFRLADAFEQLGEYERALLFAHRQLNIDPLREEAHRQIMRLHARRGERAAALAHYERARRLVADELAAELDALTVELAEQIRAGRLSPAAPVGRPLLYHFPSQFTPFFGRAAEIARLVLLLADRVHRDRLPARLCTIIGPGGMGKTRLAVAAAEAVAEHPGYPDGIYFVSLAQVASPNLLPSALAGALRQNLSGAADPVEQLITYLSPRTALMVLDNFEHLLGGAHLLVRLLEAAPGLKLLVTSRQALNVRIEERFVLDALDDEATLDLFISIAARVAPGYDPAPAERPVIASICRAVGGMPLAVELAARWVRIMDTSAINAQIRHDLDFLTTTLRDLPPRQRSMRIIFNQMWAQLSVPEAKALAALSVVRGPFRLQAAEAISLAPPLVLAQLLDRALLRIVGDGRFEVHELLRQYAATKLAAAPAQEAAAYERHARFYLALLVERGAALGGPASKEALAALRRNTDNIRAAWVWLAAHGHPDDVTRAARPLDDFYRFGGPVSEVAEVFAHTAATLGARIARAELDADATLPAIYELWRREGLLFEFQGNGTAAQQRLERARAGWAARGEQRELARVLNDLGYVGNRHGWREGVRPGLEEALRLARALGDDRLIARVLHNLGVNSAIAGNLDAGETLLRESIARYRIAGGGRWLTGALCDLGSTYVYQGEFATARELFSEGLAVSEAANDQPGIVHALISLGAVALNEGALADAEAYSRRGLAAAQEVGDHMNATIGLGNLGHVARARGEHAAFRHYRNTITLSLDIGQWPMLMEALLGLAALASRRAPVAATRWLAVVAVWRQSSGAVHEEPFLGQMRRETETQLRAMLGAAAYATAWNEGAAMSSGAAAAEALGWAEGQT